MDSYRLAPRQQLRPRGFIGLSIASLRGAFLSLPGLLVLGGVWFLVLSLAGLIAAVPVMVAGSLSGDMATGVGALMALICLPFLLIWLMAGWCALLGWVASRTLGAPLSLGEALGLGVRRALPAFGTVISIKMMGALSLLPAAFLATAIALLVGQDALPRGPWSSVLVQSALVMTALAGLGGLYVCLRLLLAPWPALLEEAGPVQAIQRGWELSRGQTGRMLFYPLLALGLVALLLDGLARLWKGDEQAALSALAARAAAWPTADEVWRGIAIGDPRSIAWLLVGMAVVGGAVALVHAGLSAFYFDRLRRMEGFGADAGRASGRPAAPVAIWPAPDGGDESQAPVEDIALVEDFDPVAGFEPIEPVQPILDAEAAVPVMRSGEAPWSDPATDAATATDPNVNEPVDVDLDPATLQEFALESPSGDRAMDRPRRSRLAWLWSWLPEPESAAERED
ncbi:MAG: hypothetical protein IPJ58_06480 [Ardenticatenia bacterium]|nr:hypothetical protein [Ardenticatenia bacterium]